MTEAEWKACTDPTPMLEFLHGKAGDRKLRLFACACCRRIWALLGHQRSRRAVEAAEAFADGSIDENQLRAARHEAQAVVNMMPADWFKGGSKGAAQAAAAAVEELADEAARESAEAEWMTCRYPSLHWPRMQRRQCAMLRCVIGNPFRPAAASPSWLAWNDGAIGKLAQIIYNDRAFDRLPLLADALEEAGCADAELLAHCRMPTREPCRHCAHISPPTDGCCFCDDGSGWLILASHARGCWALDLVLGKG